MLMSNVGFSAAVVVFSMQEEGDRKLPACTAEAQPPQRARLSATSRRSAVQHQLQPSVVVVTQATTTHTTTPATMAVGASSSSSEGVRTAS